MSAATMKSSQGPARGMRLLENNGAVKAAMIILATIAVAALYVEKYTNAAVSTGVFVRLAEVTSSLGGATEEADGRDGDGASETPSTSSSRNSVSHVEEERPGTFTFGPTTWHQAELDATGAGYLDAIPKLRSCMPLADGVREWRHPNRVFYANDTHPIDALAAAAGKDFVRHRFLPPGYAADGLRRMAWLWGHELNASAVPSFHRWLRVSPERPAASDPGAQEALLGWPVFHARSMPELCAAYARDPHRYGIHPPTLPKGACNSTFTSPPLAHPDYFPWHRRLDLVSVDCGFVFQFARGEGWWHVSTSNAMVSWLTGFDSMPTDTPVTDMEAVATAGASLFVSLPGHFTNEVLPRLVFLDERLPPGVPLLLPDTSLARGLAGMGFFHPDRPLFYSSHQLVIRAGRVFFANSPDVTKGASFTMFGMLIANRKFRVWQAARMNALRANLTRDSAAAAAAAASSSAAITGSSKRAAQALQDIPSLTATYTADNLLQFADSILVLKRRGQRTLLNHDDLVAYLKQRFPVVRIVDFEPDKDKGLAETVLEMGRARVVIGPHGANLNNCMALSPGASLIEIGYVGSSELLIHWLVDYGALARYLGIRYFGVIGESVPISGQKAINLRVNTQEVGDIVDHALNGARLPTALY